MKNTSTIEKVRLWRKATPSRKKKKKVDRISELSDEILVSILSRLTVAEATATSALSTRWRHLHSHINRLSFGPSAQLISRIREKHPQEFPEHEFPDYTKRIDDVLDLYKDIQILEEFRVDLPSLRGVNMKKWLHFALEREVESIGIHLTTHYKNKIKNHHALQYGGFYNFPRSTLKKNVELNSLPPGLESLKHLSLQGVHVEDRDVELFLLSLSGLECLSISSSDKLKNFRASGHSKLKKLNISSCNYVEAIELSDMNNLVSLRCPDVGWFDDLRCQLMPKIKLNNIPNLTHFEISDRPDQSLIDLLPTIPSCIRNQLLHLKLITDPQFMLPSRPQNYKFYRFENLKNLELEITMHCGSAAYRLIHLISACPRLENIEIKFLWRGSTLFEERTPTILNANPNRHIKRVKITGYLGSARETELAVYVIKKAVAIQELIVQPGPKTRKFRDQRRCTMGHPTPNKNTRLISPHTCLLVALAFTIFICHMCKLLGK